MQNNSEHSITAYLQANYLDKIIPFIKWGQSHRNSFQVTNYATSSNWI